MIQKLRENVVGKSYRQSISESIFKLFTLGEVLPKTRILASQDWVPFFKKVYNSVHFCIPKYTEVYLGMYLGMYFVSCIQFSCICR